MIDPTCWTPYPDTADVLTGLHRQGIKTAVVSNIGFDPRGAFESIDVLDCVDEFVLSFEVGAVKPDAAIFETALTRLGVAAGQAVMVGDSEEADGGARALGCEFVLVDPLPTSERPTACAQRWPVTACRCERGRRHSGTRVAQIGEQGA